MITVERAARDANIAAGEKEIDALYSTLARRVGEAFVPYREQEELTLTDYPALAKKLQAALAEVFGRRAGDTRSPLYQLLLTRAEREWANVFTLQANVAREQLQRDPELYEAVETVARDETTTRVVPDVATWRDPKDRQLIDRVWRAREVTWKRIDDQVRVAIVMHEAPATVALRIRRWLSPVEAHTRNRLGVIDA